MEAQKENQLSNNKLSPEEKLENALVHQSLQNEMASLVIIKTYEESLRDVPDQIKIKTIEKRLGDIERGLDGTDDLTTVMAEYDAQSNLNKSSKLDLMGRKFDKMTTGATQAELVELYNVAAVAYGESSALLTHIARRIEGDKEPDTRLPKDGDADDPVSVRRKTPESKKAPEIELPKTFAEARNAKGNSIEDYLVDIVNL